MEAKKYTVVIPAFNEEKAIAQTIGDVKKSIGSGGEIVVVDDGSVNGTLRLAVGSGVRLVVHPINMGKAAALKSGIIASTIYSDIIVTIDGDCTYEAARIPELVGLVENGADLAIGSRFLGHPGGMTLLNRFGNLLFSSLISLFTGQRVTDAQSGLRAFRKDLFYRLDVQAQGLDWETEMTAKAVREGYTVKEIPTQYYERVGESKLHPFKDGIRMLRAVFRGTRPLSGIRRYLARKTISRHIEPGGRILYLGADGGYLASHLLGKNEVYLQGEQEGPISKGIRWNENPEGYYDYALITNLQDVVDDVDLIRYAYWYLKDGGKVIIWLSNPNAYAIISWMMKLRLIGKKLHIRYYTGNINTLLRHVGLTPMMIKRCNMRINMIVIAEKKGMPEGGA